MAMGHRVDEYYMSRALSLAWRGADGVRPNPKVGCVLVKEGRVVGEGYHAAYGGPHAEIVALEDAGKKGEDVGGATAYVTLEPCSHFGKTPPCAPRLVEEGVARVVVGSVDPNPKVRGGGIALLKAAGVEVTVSCLEKECKWLNRGFFRRQTLNRPWVTLKAAASLDGRMALPSGESKWITGETARNWAHLMRAEHDAVLVGVGTILADDPELTVRHTCGKSPLRIILDTNLTSPLGARALKEGCLILTGCGDREKRRALERLGVEVCVVPVQKNFFSNSFFSNLFFSNSKERARVDLEAALQELARRDIQSVMVEGGAKVVAAFIERELCDSLAFFMANSLMGQGLGLGEGLRFDFMKDVVRLKETRVRRTGNDWFLEGIFRCSPAL
jgi:diaminohydroxyphosphoribosylaminopyrimidine deaminase/5-amino-6-(5-phosphoribosylamino)uracil reductase